MAELHKDIEGYLAKQRERVRAPVKRQDQHIESEAQEGVEEAYARRLRELGW